LRDRTLARRRFISLARPGGSPQVASLCQNGLFFRPLSDTWAAVFVDELDARFFKSNSDSLCGTDFRRPNVC